MAHEKNCLSREFKVDHETNEGKEKFIIGLLFADLPPPVPSHPSRSSYHLVAHYIKIEVFLCLCHMITICPITEETRCIIFKCIGNNTSGWRMSIISTKTLQFSDFSFFSHAFCGRPRKHCEIVWKFGLGSWIQEGHLVYSKSLSRFRTSRFLSQQSVKPVKWRIPFTALYFRNLFLAIFSHLLSCFRS